MLELTCPRERGAGSRRFISALQGLKKIVFFSCIPIMVGSNVCMGKVAFISCYEYKNLIREMIDGKT